MSSAGAAPESALPATAALAAVVALTGCIRSLEAKLHDAIAAKSLTASAVASDRRLTWPASNC